jgi:thiol-disulfide isomerase/thioredoxin
MKRSSHYRFLLLVALVLWSVGKSAYANSPVVRAVLFYSPSCGHCHKVITEDLPRLFEEYGDRLQIVGVDVSNAEGSALYGAAAEKFGIPPEEQGVPLLIVSDVALVGSLEIPEQLPILVERYLAEGGADWPDVPGLAAVVAAAAATPTATVLPPLLISATETPVLEAVRGIPVRSFNTPAEVAAMKAAGSTASAIRGVTSDDLRSRITRDPVGNGLAMVLLLGMVAGVVGTAILLRRPASERAPSSLGWAIPVLAFIGLWVAVYLAYVETTQTRAICGPVGDCNTVQRSEYALFGVLPTVYWVVGHLAILTSWVIAARGRSARRPATTPCSSATDILPYLSAFLSHSSSVPPAPGVSRRQPS